MRVRSVIASIGITAALVCTGSVLTGIGTRNKKEKREAVINRLYSSNQISADTVQIRNNANNVLFNSQDGVGDQTVILDAGEYFIYSNSNFDDLVVLGAGTSITRTGYSDLWAIPDAISAESINLSGVDAFKSSDWQYKQLTNNKYLTLQEMQIVTVGADTEVVITPAPSTTALSSILSNVLLANSFAKIAPINSLVAAPPLPCTILILFSIFLISFLCTLLAQSASDWC